MHYRASGDLTRMCCKQQYEWHSPVNQCWTHYGTCGRTSVGLWHWTNWVLILEPILFLTWGFWAAGSWWSQWRGRRCPRRHPGSSPHWPGRCSGRSPACCPPGMETRPSAWRRSRPLWTWEMRRERCQTTRHGEVFFSDFHCGAGWWYQYFMASGKNEMYWGH